MPYGWGKFILLRRLWLSGNLIVSLPVDGLVLLPDFDPVTGVRKQVFAKGFGGLHSLEELWLDNNRLKTITGQIAWCTSLKYLNLRRNLIQDLPDDFGNMHSLQYLVCSHNLLEKVPDSLYTLPNLHTLRLDSNRLQLLTDSVVMATSLTDLDVSHNPMLCLPPEISQCEDLVRIKTVHSGHRSNTQNLSGYWSKMHSTMKLVPMVCKSGTRIDYQECRPKTTTYQPVPISLGQSQTTRPSTRASTCIRASSLSVQHESESTENPRLGIMATFGNPAKVDTVYSPPPLSVRPPQTPFSCARTEATCRFSGAYHESDSI